MNTSEVFLNRLPRRPFCANDVSHGLLIRPAATAIKHRHIQPNAPLEVAWLIFDLDYTGAAFAWEKANLPPPTIAVSNPANGHAHLFYGLTTPVVVKSTAAREAPIRYANSVHAAFLARLRADPGYTNGIAKNPLHPSWRSIWVNHLYDLGELAEYVTLPKRLPRRESFGVGRNCTLFDALRSWSYQWAREYKRNGASREQWRDAVLGQATRMNNFDTPLAYSEVKALAKSVANWTWSHFDDARFSGIQSARGKLGGRPKTTTRDGEPWTELGISRATYYRHLNSGLLVPK
jgi:hypothetical protein